MNEDTLLKEIAQSELGNNVIMHNQPAKIITTTGFEIEGILLKVDTRAGTALVRQDNTDGTYTITSMTHVLTIQQTRNQGE